jgi:exodeoxyribonuclease VII small subunit
MTPNPAEEDISTLTYEAALAELDTLITKLEGGSIALEEAIGAYERGAVLAQHCADLLERTEQRVNQLVVSASGGMSERPLEAMGAPAPETRSTPAVGIETRGVPGPETRGVPAAPPVVRPASPRIDPDDVPF